MKLEIAIIAVTGFVLYNMYHGNNMTKILSSYKKYMQMCMVAFGALVFYLLLKKNPNRCKNMLLHANGIVKYLPIDKSSVDMLSPILDFTTQCNNGGEYPATGRTGGTSFMQSLNNGLSTQPVVTATKRSVSETKKKYVASMQNWKCGHCHTKLNAWFEVDHKVRLEYGGGNEVENLVALCRECHGKKTALENM